MSASLRYLPREHPGAANEASARPVKISANPFDRDREKTALPCASFRSSVCASRDATLRPLFFHLHMTQLRQTVKTFRRRSTQKRPRSRRVKNARSPTLRTLDAIASCENAEHFAASSSFQRLLSLKNKLDATTRTNGARRRALAGTGFSSRRLESAKQEKTTKTGERVKSAGRKRDNSFRRVFSPYTFVSTFPVVIFTTFLAKIHPRLTCRS